jgi:hypothetical protein
MNDIKPFIPRHTGVQPSQRSSERDMVKKARSFSEFLPPEERGFQSIPNADVLHSMIGRALDALKHGVFWDRGSILNIKV